MTTSTINFNQIAEKFRFDAEYYRPEFLETENLLRKTKHNFLFEIAKISKAKKNPTRTPEVEFQYIDISNIDLILGAIDTQNIKGFLAPSRARKLVRKNDIIISTVRPNRNAIAIIPEELDGIICSTGFSVIKAEKVNPYFLFAFLKTKFAIHQLIRQTMASMYPAVSEEDIADIIVPVVSDKIQKEIENLIRQAHQKKKLADEKCGEAEENLYELLGHKELNLKSEKSFEAEAVEVFSTMRFDSEYYQPKYKEIIEILNKSNFKAEKLEKIIKISTKKINPKANPTKKIKYVELANINPSTGEIDSFNELYGYEAPSRARMAIKVGDVVVASLAGSLDNIGIVPKELDGEVASTGFFVVNSENYLNEFLFLLFRSEIMKKQLEQKTAGAIMAAVPKSVFGDLLVPVIPKQKQEKIAELVKQSFALRKEAKQLLDETTKRVENLIK